MRILLFSSSYAPRVGGLETVTRRLAQQFRIQGHDVTVITNRYPWRLPSLEVLDGVPVYRRFFPDMFPPRDRRMTRAALRQALLLLAAPVSLLRLLLLVRRLRPDVVNAHYFSYPVVYGVLAARILKLPVVLSFHGSDLSSTPYPPFYRSALRIACRQTQSWTIPSAALRDRLVPLLPAGAQGDACVIPNAVDDWADKSVPSGLPEPFILVAARLVEVKGVDVAIRALAEMTEARLVIAGDGPLRASLEALVGALGLQARITILGTVSHEQTLGLMRQAALVVVPSRLEGFGLVCLEAMIAAKPVIATRVGAIPEIVVDGETGILVESDDPRAMAGAIRCLLHDRERARAMGLAGRKRALSTYGWHRTTDRYLALFERTVRRTSSAAVPHSGMP